MFSHYTNDSANSEWLKLMADMETEDALTPAQTARTPSVIMSRETAKDIDLSGIYRMCREDIEAAMAPQEVAA